MNFLTRLVALGFVSTALIAPFAHATPIAASMNAGIRGYLGSNEQNPLDAASWGALGSSLSVGTNLLISGEGGDQTSGYVNGTADWAADGNSGSVTVNYGWSNAWNHTLGGGGITPNLGPSAPNWSYTFIADASGTATLSYNIVGAGNMFGLQGFQFSGPSHAEVVEDPFNPTASGTINFTVVQGTQYTMWLDNAGSLGGSGDWAGSVRANFEWTLPGRTTDAVPDSALTVWLLVIAAVAAVAISSFRHGRLVPVRMVRGKRCE